MIQSCLNNKRPYRGFTNSRGYKMKRSTAYNTKSLQPEAEQMSVQKDQDLVSVRACGRKMAAALGFSKKDQTLVAMALSEIGRNMLQYSGSGKIMLKIIQSNEKIGIGITATDEGPGIEDVEEAMTDGFSTRKGMGIGLPAVQRIMDDFTIESQKGVGTTIRMSKWKM